MKSVVWKTLPFLLMTTMVSFWMLNCYLYSIKLGGRIESLINVSLDNQYPYGFSLWKMFCIDHSGATLILSCIAVIVMRGLATKDPIYAKYLLFPYSFLQGFFVGRLLMILHSNLYYYLYASESPLALTTTGYISEYMTKEAYFNSLYYIIFLFAVVTAIVMFVTLIHAWGVRINANFLGRLFFIIIALVAMQLLVYLGHYFYPNRVPSPFGDYKMNLVFLCMDGIFLFAISSILLYELNTIADLERIAAPKSLEWVYVFSLLDSIVSILKMVLLMAIRILRAQEKR